MTEYYFLKGKDQKGPFIIEQLSDKGLTNETLVWTEGMENWKKLKDIPELVQTLKPKSVPPPHPNETDEIISKTEVSGQLKVTTERSPNPTLEALKPTQTTLTWLIIWCGFHLFALLMSYSQVKIFNSNGNPETDKFWPFVTFRYDIVSEKGRRIREYGSMTTDEYWDKDAGYYGFFTEYDWTEFALYVGGSIIIYLLVRVSNKQEETEIKL